MHSQPRFTSHKAMIQASFDAHNREVESHNRHHASHWLDLIEADFGKQAADDAALTSWKAIEGVAGSQQSYRRAAWLRARYEQLKQETNP